MKIGIVGSRCFCDKNVKTIIQPLIENYVQKQLSATNITIISGGAKGIDTLAKEYAHSREIPLIEHLPKKYTTYELLARNTLICKR